MSITSIDIEKKLIHIIKEAVLAEDQLPQMTTVGQAINFIRCLDNIPGMSIPFVFIGNPGHSIGFEWARNKKNIIVEFYDDIIEFDDNNKIKCKTDPTTLHKFEMLSDGKSRLKAFPFNSENPADNHEVMLEVFKWFTE